MGSLERLAYSIWLNGFRANRNMVMMYTGYFDASGSPDDTVAFVVGGYISTIEQWLRFDIEWKEALDEFGVDCFHMHEFAHSTGRFSEWKSQETKRKEFLSRLIGIIARRTNFSFSCAVILDDFKDVNRVYPLQEAMGHPYPFCAYACIAFIQGWCEQYSEQFPELVFEKGDTHKGELMELMEMAELELPIFKGKCEVCPLQAADLLAWENLKVYKSVLSGLFDFRVPFQMLNRLPRKWAVYDLDKLTAIMQNMRMPKRDGLPPAFLENLKEDRMRRIKEARRKRKNAPD